MLKRSLPVFVVPALLSAMLLMSGCGGGDFDEVQASDSGYMLEQVFPEETWFFVSLSTLDDDQRAYFGEFVARFTDDPGALRDTILSGVDSNLDSINLSYIEDIEPMLGQDGIRFAFGLSEDGANGTMTNVAFTVDDVSQAENLLTTLETEGRFVRKTRDEFDLYYNVLTEENVFYFSLFEDLFVISNSEDQLVNMLSLARSNGGHSLWTNESYQDVISELPAEHVGMIYMDSQMIIKRQEELSGVSAFASSGTAEYLKAQGLALMAIDGGLEFRGIALGDKEKLDADGESLDKLGAKKRYLYKDIPGQNLLAYFESYNLAQEVIEAVDSPTGPGYAQGIQTMLGVTQEDLERFLGEGYGVAIHRNSGFLPGITFMIDVSDGSLTAQAVVDELDSQLSSWIGLFQLQGGEIAAALTKDVAEVQGGEFAVIRLDVDTVMGMYESSGAFAVPDAIDGMEVVLMYGLTDDDRLMISMYEGWLEDPSIYLSDNNVYKETTDHLKKFKEGMFYLDFDQLMAYIEEFSEFREALGLDADSILSEYPGILGGDTTEAVEVEVEMFDEEGNLIEESTDVEVEVEGGEVEDGEVEGDDVEESTSGGGVLIVDPVPSAEEALAIDWFEFLAPLKSFALSSSADKYEIKLGGVLLLDE